ncbi:glutathione S-transferase [Rhodoferax saidenbachensis]|uniref:Glutathione S-transferase n=1 Tax=Rhodoferax saidenbachensis TaxID=1484693 RepID=A0A1P8KBJ4_9BURK|nr:glutathione S-transferase [Rhodoferax saidenbachensis]APW43345.1 glutathione S-transferase [Rhodoferax saidenbachensis]
MRARLALAASGQVCVLREIALARKPAEMLAASPKGTVPVLVLADGTVIEQSLDIMRWALHRHDPHAWLPEGEGTLAEALQWIATCDGPFKVNLDRYKYPSRYALENGAADRDQGAAFLAQLESKLAIQPFLTGTHFGFTDAAIAPFVRQFAHTDTGWFAAQPWPALQDWLQAFEASPLFAAVMHKQPEWVAGNPDGLFAPQIRSLPLQTL